MLLGYEIAGLLERGFHDVGRYGPQVGRRLACRRDHLVHLMASPAVGRDGGSDNFKPVAVVGEQDNLPISEIFLQHSQKRPTIRVVKSDQNIV